MKTSSYSAPSSYERHPPSTFTKRDSILSIENCLGQSIATKQQPPPPSSSIPSSVALVAKEGAPSTSRTHYPSSNQGQNHLVNHQHSFVNRAHTVDGSSGKSSSCSTNSTHQPLSQRAIPKRKLMVMSMLQNQLEEQRQKKVAEQQQEYIQSTIHLSSHQTQNSKVNRMTINHNLIVNSEEHQQGMFQELKEFLDPFGLEQDDSPHLSEHNSSTFIKDTPNVLLQQHNIDTISPTFNPSPNMLQNNLPFNLEAKHTVSTSFRKKPQPKEYMVKITNLPNSITMNDIHNLILERCKIISENIQIKQAKTNSQSKYALIDMQSKEDAQQVKTNIEGLKMDLHELKVKIKVKKQKTTQSNDKKKQKSTNNDESIVTIYRAFDAQDATSAKSVPPPIENFFTSIQIDYKITESVEDILGYTYCNKSYLMIALTHGHPTMKEWTSESRRMISSFLQDPHFVIFADHPTLDQLISHSHNEIEHTIIMSSLMKLNTLDQYCNKFTSGYNVVSVSDLADCFLSLMYSVKEDCQGDEEELKVVLWRMYQPLGCLVSANISEQDLEMLLQRGATCHSCQHNITPSSINNTKWSTENFNKLVNQNLITDPNGELNYEGMIFSEECLGKALHYASRASSKSTSSIKALIRRGADPNFRWNGFTPLMIAKTPSQIKTLIQCGAALDDVSEPHGLGVLRCAVERRNLAVVNYLLEEFGFVTILEDQILQATDHAIQLVSRSNHLDEKKKAKLFEIIEVLQNALTSNMD
ncbi:hypothetical protein C9374_014187 [Naegleria lovaniensis]|uniref:RRM domain-containing protein n=1 Tax=Naegleria lovaniensis TaxID=51637 RepID=A0AA88GYU9_NAELO|nr:uncharacterized protein C9374_014187 [Naegleria lovaniensis]KAG2389627.1 hypothetical protein C9374_014187 [Naegleria lovaniensis]